MGIIAQQKDDFITTFAAQFENIGLRCFAKPAFNL